MTTLQESFEAAAAEVKSLTKRPTDEELLELYGFFKQSVEGDNNTSKPSLFDLKGKMKWEYWNKQRGTTKEEAQESYIAKVNELIHKYRE
ncbi:acyl-CoA-binding protein homolog [Daktulosphaira vitifoliae]|uniref:acyl-CoA-binding protein homolog n=1 Tax=Daktulosphaira vitifoliae TaxID=58002 RepID=UPI0021AA138F|nr:acyl-CoA-binding protein homolog [Daktulosphaira vitifoliae]